MENMFASKSETIYSKTRSGKLMIHDDKRFILMLSGNQIESKEVYSKLLEFCKKTMSQMASDIPYQEHESLITWSIFKAVQSFDDKSGSNFLTYLYSKLRGEVSDYRQRREASNKKVQAVLNDVNNTFVYQLQEDVNTIEQIDDKSTEDEIFEKDSYYRKMQAFKMAFSGIPRNMQEILTMTALSDFSISEISEIMNIPEQELIRKRNLGLTLILSRVMRSNHLDEEEKNLIRQEHGIS